MSPRTPQYHVVEGRLADAQRSCEGGKVLACCVATYRVTADTGDGLMLEFVSDERLCPPCPNWVGEGVPC